LNHREPALDPANRFDQAFNHIALIVNRKLDRNVGPIPGGNVLIKYRFDFLMFFDSLRIFKAVNQHEKPAIHAVGKQGHQGKEIDKKPKVLKEIHHNWDRVRMTRTVQIFFESIIKKKNPDRDTIRFVLIQAIFFISQELRKDLTGKF
jgi:hypothetical protein